jgi:hypothetical protein
MFPSACAKPGSFEDTAPHGRDASQALAPIGVRTLVRRLPVRTPGNAAALRNNDRKSMR